MLAEGSDVTSVKRHLHRPHGRLHRSPWLIPVAIPCRAVLIPTLMAGPGQECLHRSLHK
jgi:hypothetical protein